MAQTKVDTAAHVLSWLRHGRREDLPVDRVLEAIRSVYGVVPLGGRVGGSDGATPKKAALTLFSAQKDGHAVETPIQDPSDDKLWSILLSSVQLPISGSQEEVRNALQTLQKQQKAQSALRIEKLRRQYFAGRRNFFTVRVALFCVSQNLQHPNAQTAKEVVDELLKEGLREALQDEIHGRQFVDPPSFAGVGAAERIALKAWELQFLEEETLLRELLLLTLEASPEKATLESAMKFAKTIYNWEVRVFDEVFTASTLAIVDVQETARRSTQMGLLVALRLLHTIEDGQDFSVLQHVTKTFFLTELSGAPFSDNGASPVPGVLVLAWATFLGRQYRQMLMMRGAIEHVKELQMTLQQTLGAAERLHSFHYLNALLRSLTCCDYGDSDYVAMLHPLSLHVKKLWELPTVASSGARTHTPLLPDQNYRDHAQVYQQVVTAFINDMLSTLGYMEHLYGAQELHAMVKFVLPALCNARVAQVVLESNEKDSETSNTFATGDAIALGDLLLKARVNLPGSLLPCVELLMALCCQFQDVSSPTVLRQALNLLSQSGAGLADGSTKRVCRPVPPAAYYSQFADESDRLQCTRSFAYEDGDDRLVVLIGTIGTLVQTNDEVQVEWLLTDSKEGTNTMSLSDMVLLRADRFATELQLTSLAQAYRANPEDAGVLTAFFGFIVQLGKQEDSGQWVLEEMQQRWGEARLRGWWTKCQISSPEVYVPLLMKQQISLLRLLSASSESLVSWNIQDRHVRHQILAHSTHLDVNMSHASTMNAFAIDGGLHLLRLLLSVLHGFMHGGPSAEDDSGCASYCHLVTASFLALQTLLATTFGVTLLVTSSLDGGREECVQLIVRSAKKLFEIHERLFGVYSVVLATQEIFMSVVRWFLSKEAQALSNAVPKADSFVAMERLWFATGAEFAIEVLSTYESWKYVCAKERCEVSERCVRLLYVLLHPRKYIHEPNELIFAFEASLCETLSTDMLLVAKLLRLCCAGVSGMAIDPIDDWNSAAKTEEDRGAEADHYLLLANESARDDTEVTIAQLDPLVTTCLRVVELLLSSQTNRQAAQKILLMPINGLNTRSSLTLVTLCGRYLGYDGDDAPDIVYWSLRVLQRAAVVLDFRFEQEGPNRSSMHSLFALFHDYQDFSHVRSKFAQLLRVSSPRHVTIRTEVIEMLTLCLVHQPNFLALLLFGSPSKENQADNDALPVLSVLYTFFETSEKLLEQASDLLCALLTFLVTVWHTAIHDSHNVPLRIVTALRARPAFWPNVTRVLKIYMPTDSIEEHGRLDMELAAATAEGRGEVENLFSSFIGRSSAYGYLARGLILQLVLLEWYNQASKQRDHPLVDVLETFRKEGLYLHWLRSLTRLDYSPARFEQHTVAVRRSKRPMSNLLSALPVGKILTYVEGLICDACTLKWQLSTAGEFNKLTCSADIRALKLVQWGNLQAAYLHAQLFSMAKLKAFMELRYLQAGAPSDTIEAASLPRIRSGGLPMQLTMPACSSSDSTLCFSGDCTSIGLIEALVDGIQSRLQQHENTDDPLDYFVLVHLQALVELLVSMLHHQSCLADPMLSQTQDMPNVRGVDSSLKVDMRTTLAALVVIEKVTTAVHESSDRIAREFKVMRLDSSSETMLGEKLSVVPLFCRLVTDFEHKVESVTIELLSSLITATLLLIRLLSEMPNDSTSQDSNMERFSLPESRLKAKFIQHSIQGITLCNDHRKASGRSTRVLYQLSCSLFQAVLGTLSMCKTRNVKLHMGMSADLMPFIKELAHDHQGINALVHQLVQSFRAVQYPKRVAARQEEACHVLHSLTAVVWNPANVDLCRCVMLQGGNWLLVLLATELLPLLQIQMEREQWSTKLRGYVSSEDKMEAEFDRSLAHRMWCLVLDFVGGLLRLSSSVDTDAARANEFLAYAEPMLLSAIEPAICYRMTRALVAEHQALLRFLNGLCGTAWRRQRWRQAFPTSFVVLMEQSRLLLRRACVLLGDSCAEFTCARKETSPMKAKRSSKVVAACLKSPRSPRSPSAFKFVRPTLLQEHLQAVVEDEKQAPTRFYQEMETELVAIVQLSSLLLVKWTPSLTERGATAVVDGVRYMNDEQLVPLLEFSTPSKARSMQSSPGLGHLGLAMNFILDQLEKSHDESQIEPRKRATVMENAMNVCALLFGKTYLLHAEQYELVKRDRDELQSFMRHFGARVSKIDSAGVDVQLFEQIRKIIAG